MTSGAVERAILPAMLLEKATMLAGEPAWPAPVAKQAIKWLADHDLAVVGVELWRAAGGVPRWIASSDYRRHGADPWPAAVRACADGAIAFVRRFDPQPGALFNLTWIDQEEAAAPSGEPNALGTTCGTWKRATSSPNMQPRRRRDGDGDEARRALTSGAS